MSNYDIELASLAENGAYPLGFASFKRSGTNTWSRVYVSGLHRNDCYFIFYILQNPQKHQSAAEMGRIDVDSQGSIEFERDFDNRIANGYCHKEKEVVGVVMVERQDCALTTPVAGFTEEAIEWRTLVKPYMMALECNHIICDGYSRNEIFDNIIDNLPPSQFFEPRDKIERAVELSNLRQTGLEELISGIADYERSLLIRMRTGDYVLYLLGLPGTYGGWRQDYEKYSFNTFLCNRAGEVPRDDSSGFWCRYIL